LSAAFHNRIAKALTAPSLAHGASLDVIEKFRRDAEWACESWELPAWSQAVLDCAEIELDWGEPLPDEVWVARLSAAYVEAEHPRDAHGHWADKPGGGRPRWMPRFGRHLVNPKYASAVKERRADEQRIRGIGHDGGVEGYQREVENHMRALYADADVSIRLKSAAIPNVFAAGRYRNRTEDEIPRFAFQHPFAGNTRTREGAEIAVWGEHPVYGYLSTPEENMKGPMEAYGDAKLILKPHVRDRVTTTWGDSLGGITHEPLLGPPKVLPSPLDNPSAYSVAPDARDPMERNDVNPIRQVRSFLVDGYVEAQILGGVHVDDVAYVRFLAQPEPEVVMALYDWGIPWAIGKLPPVALGQRSVTMPTPLAVKSYREGEHPRDSHGRFARKPGTKPTVTLNPEQREGLAHIVQLMTMVRDLWEGNQPENHGFHYIGRDDVVLREGRVFTDFAHEDPKDDEYCTPRQCFTNALHIALRSHLDQGGNEPRRTYVEGMAMKPGLIPVHHAWTVDEAGRVYDPTWQHEPNTVYIGVPVRWQYLAHHVSAQGTDTLFTENFDYRQPIAEEDLVDVGVPLADVLTAQKDVKREVHVEPYMREGHLVQGYTRTLADVLEADGWTRNFDGLPKPQIDAENKDEARKLAKDFHGLHRNGMTLAVQHVTGKGRQTRITGFVYSPELAGGFDNTPESGWQFMRQFNAFGITVDHKDNSVKWDELFVPPHGQSAGFGSAVRRYIEAWAVDNDKPTIKITAAHTGAYAWARAGFDLASPHNYDEIERLFYDVDRGFFTEDRWLENGIEIPASVPDSVLHDFLDRLPDPLELERVGEIMYDRFGPDVATPEQIAEVYGEHMNSRTFKSLQEIAAFGRDHTWQDDQHGTMWLGKAMLLGKKWEGVKHLTPDGKTLSTPEISHIYDAWEAAQERVGGAAFHRSSQFPDAAGFFRDDRPFWDAVERANSLAGKAFREQDHPRYPPGHPRAGEFMDKPDADYYRQHGRLNSVVQPVQVGHAISAPPDPRRHFPHLPHRTFASTNRPPVQEFRPPPPPKGVRGARKAGGFAGNGQTNTKIGDLGESMVEHLDFTSLLPPGRRQNPLDSLWDDSRWGFEVKTVTTHATEYKVAMKSHEVQEKRAYAQERGLLPATMIVVLDADAGEAHAYWREGIANGRLNDTWNYAGTVNLDQMAPSQPVPGSPPTMAEQVAA
jgi:hypothetical protein